MSTLPNVSGHVNMSGLLRLHGKSQISLQAVVAVPIHSSAAHDVRSALAWCAVRAQLTLTPRLRSSRPIMAAAPAPNEWPVMVIV